MDKLPESKESEKKCDSSIRYEPITTTDEDGNETEAVLIHIQLFNPHDVPVAAKTSLDVQLMQGALEGFASTEDKKG